MDNIIWFISLWAVVTVLGLISWPIVSIFFNHVSDKGYSISKIIGLFFVGYSTFLLSSLKLVSLNSSQLIISPIVWGSLNLYFLIKYKPLKKIVFKHVFVSEVVFLLLYFLCSYVKAYKIEIHQIERLMDFGFIRIMENTKYLPLEDIWMSGLDLNYYYFGHLMGYILIFFSGVPSEVGFFLLVSIVFGMVGSSMFRLSFDLSAYIIKSSKSYKNYISAILSVYFILFSGVFHTPVNKIIFRKNFTYSDVTRLIPGTITEPPLYSFIESDLHSHVWGLLIGSVTLFLIYNAWVQKDIKSKLIYLLGFTIGLSVMTNTWDAITLGFLIVSVLSLKTLLEKICLKKLLIHVIILIVMSYFTSFLWLASFKTPTSSISFVQNSSKLLTWLSFWGHYVSIFLIYILVFLKIGKLEWKKQSFLLVNITVSFLLIALTEIIFVKDILWGGEWERANTVFKVTTQTWLWLGLFSGPTIVWCVSTVKKLLPKIVIAILFLFIFILTSFYPIMAINQSYFEGGHVERLDSGLHWFEQSYPLEYEAFLFLLNLKNNLPLEDKKKVILEARGESYRDTSLFSTFLGWPTVIGWDIHEWTWRGSYRPIRKRIEDVREIYTGYDLEITRELLDKYQVDFIIISSFERSRYGFFLNEGKLQKLSKKIFQNTSTSIYLVLR